MGKETDAGCGSVAAPVERHVRPHGCACDFRTYMVGDGCAACDPEKALEFLRDTVDDQADEIDRLRAALLDARDCRTCRNFTTRSGGCVSVLRCVDGSGYQRQGQFQYWEAAPLDPAPF